MAKPIRETPRGIEKRTTYPLVVIVCEGKKTEPTYFEHFRGRHKPIKIEIVTNAAGKNYDAIIAEAIKAKDKYVTGTESSYSVWCVSDVDVDYNTPDSQSAKNARLKKYSKDASRNGFKIVLSNPCFELWFLLHFAYSTGYI